MAFEFPARPLQTCIQGSLSVILFGTLALVYLLRWSAYFPAVYGVVFVVGCGGAALPSIWTVSNILLVLRERSRALSHLPGPTYSIFGLISALRVKDPHRLAAVWADKYGPVVKLRILFFHAVMVTDPVLAGCILNNPAFDKFPFLYDFLGPLLGGPNLLSSPTDNHWRNVRKSVSPAFSTVHMREAARLVVASSNQLVEFLKRKGPGKAYNMERLLLHVAADVIGEFGFQQTIHAMASIEDEETAEEHSSEIDSLMGATLEIEKAVQQPLRAFDPFKRKEREHGHNLIKKFRGVIETLIDNVKKSDLRKGCFADLLLEARDPDTGGPLKDDRVKPEVSALFFAGMDTTAHSNTWLMYLLAQHPEVEARVAEELDGLKLLATPERPSPRSLDHADLAKLVYLQATVKEMLRMYPPLGLGQVRVSPQDVAIGGRLNIPKGTLVWVPHHGIMNTEVNWEKPRLFQPERFLQPDAELSPKLPLDASWYAGIDPGKLKKPKRYFPFAEGPRNCVGQNLAKLSLLATAATLTCHFKFRLADRMGGPAGVSEKEMYTLITTIEGGMWMHAVPRVTA